MTRIFTNLLLVLFSLILPTQNILYNIRAEYTLQKEDWLQIVDELERKVKDDSKQLLLYIFDNGSINKKIQIID